MTFTYTPLDKREPTGGFSLLEEGEYNFTVVDSTFKTSKSSNPMIELKIAIGEKGKEHFIFDYLIDSANSAWKIYDFCYCVGLSHEYHEKLFNETMCPGKKGRARIGQQKGKDKPDGGRYPDRNVVLGYIVDEATKSDKPEFDDEIPF